MMNATLSTSIVSMQHYHMPNIICLIRWYRIDFTRWRYKRNESKPRKETGGLVQGQQSSELKNDWNKKEEEGVDEWL